MNNVLRAFPSAECHTCTASSATARHPQYKHKKGKGSQSFRAEFWPVSLTWKTGASSNYRIDCAPFAARHAEMVVATFSENPKADAAEEEEASVVIAEGPQTAEAEGKHRKIRRCRHTEPAVSAASPARTGHTPPCKALAQRTASGCDPVPPAALRSLYYLQLVPRVRGSRPRSFPHCARVATDRPLQSVRGLRLPWVLSTASL